MSTDPDHPAPLTCPACHSDYVRRSRRTGLLDRLFSSFAVYPFRCQLCRHRFHRLQKGVTYTRIDEDRREYERLPIDLAVTLSLGTRQGQGTLTDLSMAGCSLGTEIRFEPGDILRLQVQLPDQAEVVDVQEAVLRGLHANQAKLEFLRFKTGDEARLQQFIRERIRQGVSRS
ncbi:hypothetical protein GETHLI_16000 [Geothrix limicola]|uniref:PilZ domain-containing protein n=1 Tax=Geothrix limicola TaxID=2927978 RepID=A0ABQ5QEV9_9BACT|nr:PilZ domain-containing protein [Geothrix limicola]GLH73098.1 hypothetical protein GETHLI_16000 [Geothrix limicola]